MSCTRFIRRFVAVGLVSISIANALPAQDAVAKELTRLEDLWASAYSKHDAATIGAFLSEDYLAIWNTGVPVSKASLLKDISTTTTNFVSTTNKTLQIKVHGNTAVIVGIATEVSKGAKGNVTARYGYTDTWMKQADGKWLCVAAQSTLLK